MPATAWALLTAARIGWAAGASTASTGRPRRNPFHRRGLDDLAGAWQHAYDRAVHPATGRCHRPRIPSPARFTAATHARHSRVYAASIRPQPAHTICGAPDRPTRTCQSCPSYPAPHPTPPTLGRTTP